MKNKLDKQYTDLLQDILNNGVVKSDRTGTGTISIFGRQIRHNMQDGFPLITTKKMAWKSVVTELMWFLKGDTNIKYLVDNDCHIWNGDAYKNYCSQPQFVGHEDIPSMEWFVNEIKNNSKFANKFGNLGPTYGKQWRRWTHGKQQFEDKNGKLWLQFEYHDQIKDLIEQLKTNPDSRRLMVNAWNVGELDQMTLPPCHYSFQVYTRELSLEERFELFKKQNNGSHPYDNEMLDDYNIPTRAISLMWNQRSVDTFLGLPFNIASYGLLLEIIAKAVNMVPDELIGNLGDVHLYSNHIEQAKEQIGRKLSLEERHQLALPIWKEKYGPLADMMVMTNVDNTPYKIPKRTREPFPLPTLNINTEWWPTEGGECGVGLLNAVTVFNSFADDSFCKCLLEEDIQLCNYQCHPSIKAPLNN